MCRLHAYLLVGFGMCPLLQTVKAQLPTYDGGGGGGGGKEKKKSLVASPAYVTSSSSSPPFVFCITSSKSI